MDLVTARLLARKGALVPADFTSLLAWRLEKGGAAADEPGFNGVITEVLLEETSFEEYEAGFNVDLSDDLQNSNIKYGQTFVVTVDGVAYRCVAWAMYGEPRIGDSRLVHEDQYAEFGNTNPEDVPFLIDYYAEMDEVTWEETIYAGVTFSTAGTHTLKIEREIVIPKTEIVITGNETFNFQAADNTVYYKNSDFVNVPHKNIVFASCTHFEWDDGAVIADLDDGKFLFNYTKSTGIGTGNISFKRNDLFTSSSAAKEWFKEQADSGKPVTITVYVKK